MIQYKKILMTLALLLTAVTGAWADGIVCTASDKGKVLCTDGSIYENVSAATTAGKTAAAVIAYVDETNKNGLAIALADEESEMNWSTAKSTCEGKTAITGAKWCLPSQDQLKQMFKANGGNEGSYSGLNTAITTAGGTALQDLGVYWSSTPDGEDRAWAVGLTDGSAYWGNGSGDVNNRVRACLAIAEPTEWDLTPDADKKVWTLAKMPASNVELQVEYEPTKVTMAANDNAMGTVEVAGQSKVEWTADTWKGWTQNTKVYTVDDITMTSSESGHIREYISEDKYNNSLFFFVRKMVDDATVTFSTTGDPFSRIEFTMIGDYSERNPDIIPNDNWTFEGKSAVWEGEATKSLTLQSCSTNVSKITFFKGAAIPDGVTVNGDGTFTVAKTATVTLKATPAEGYKFLYWEDDKTNTNPVREVTIESGMADKTYKAVFAEILYNVTFVEGTNLDEWSATPNTEVKKETKVDIKYTGTKKVIGMKVEKKAAKLDDEGHALSASAVGEIVGSDGKAYAVADKDNLPSGVTAVAMVAYKSGSNGLAIQLNSSPVQKNWDEAKTYVEGLTAVSGGTWRLPSKADWQNMFVSCAVSGDASASDEMNPIAGFKAKIAATSITWKSEDYYWSSTESDMGAWSVLVNLGDSNAAAFFDQHSTSSERNVLGCLAF